MRRVLVTRPEPGAGRTAGRLRELGFKPLVLPLSQTRPLTPDTAALPADAAAVAVTSANALRHASAGLIDGLAALPCHAVGERTAAAARHAGLRSATAGPGDAEALAKAIAPALAGRTLVYLCGRERFPAFEERLAAAGVQVHPVETYDTVALEPSDETVLALLAGRSVDAVLLYSVKAAQAAAGLFRRRALLPQFERAAIFSLSARIAAAFAASCPGHRGRTHVAPKPDEQALLGRLEAEG